MVFVQVSKYYNVWYCMVVPEVSELQSKVVFCLNVPKSVWYIFDNIKKSFLTSMTIFAYLWFLKVQLFLQTMSHHFFQHSR